VLLYAALCGLLVGLRAAQAALAPTRPAHRRHGDRPDPGSRAATVFPPRAVACLDWAA
jgi:hypothetical protein